MSERKIIFLLVATLVYSLYSFRMWFSKETVSRGDGDVVKAEINLEINKDAYNIAANDREPNTLVPKRKVIKLYYKNACSILDVFTKKPTKCNKKTIEKKMEADSNSIAVFAVMVFLIVLTINAILDVLKVKEEERIKRKENPDGERRQSLAEFANKKSLRRESSKFGLQLFQIAESVFCSEEKKPVRQTRPYTRGESTNSYLTEKFSGPEDPPTPTRSSETPTGEPRTMKRQSVAKILGARPAPMVRRSSFPALPLNPDIQALMLGNRRPSTDSDDEDGRGRRVRIIRRY